MMTKHKKGISTVIATILMILFVLGGASIVWVITQNILEEQTGDISESLARITLRIEEVSETGQNIEIIVSRDIGKGELSAVKIIFYDSAGQSFSQDINATNLNELGNRLFTIPKTELSPEITNLKKIAVAPIMLDEKNKEIIQRITHTYEIPSAIILN